MTATSTTDCEVCARAATPARVENRPGLSAVAFRLGTFGSFRAAMVDRIANDPTLQALNTAAVDDHGVTFVELCAAVADVLTFYQERYVNEVWLGTAAQQRSVERLAELIGYRPTSGLAAEAWLAFTLEDGAVADIPAGLVVQSVPGPGEVPQTYETLSSLAADARLNALTARVAATPANPPFAAESTQVTLDPVSGPSSVAGMRGGDRVVLFGGGAVENRTVEAVVTTEDQVVVRWTTPVKDLTGAAPRAYRCARVLRLFGGSAPRKWQVPTVTGDAVSWAEETTEFDGSGTTLELDGQVDDLPVGTTLLVVTAGAATEVELKGVASEGVEVGPLADTVTVLTVSASVNWDRRTTRIYVLGEELRAWGDDYPTEAPGTVVHVPGFAAPQDDGVAAIEVGATIDAGAWKAGAVLRLDELEVGRALLVGPVPSSAGSAGRVDPVPATLVSADLDIDGLAEGDLCHLALTLDYDGVLGASFDRLQVLGNVVRASHGESVAEVLGDGDASAAFTSFTLAKQPLTHLSSATAGGSASTLTVYVDGVARTEVDSLYGQSGSAPVYTARTQPDGATEVRFGDGVTGAPPTTGVANVTARYRKGAGVGGRVDAGQLATLLTPVTGVRSATNPLPAEGGADAEDVSAARTNAPRSVRTLGRAVSLRDVEDLATESGLAAKAVASWVWDGYERVVHLTVAAQDGAALGATSLSELVASLDAARDTNHRLRAADHTAVPVQLAATVVVDRAAEDAEAVVVAAGAAASAALDFDAVSLGTSVHLSDVIAVMAAVPGVLGVDVDLFGFLPSAAMTDDELDRRGVTRRSDGTVAPVQGHLRVFGARPDPASPGAVLPAELPTIANPSTDLVVLEGAGT